MMELTIQFLDSGFFIVQSFPAFVILLALKYIYFLISLCKIIVEIVCDVFKDVLFDMILIPNSNKFAYSLSHHQAGQMYISHYVTNVQDFSTECFNSRIFSISSLLRWHQVLRLPSYIARSSFSSLFLIHI